jgi:deoxyribonuclease V
MRWPRTVESARRLQARLLSGLNTTIPLRRVRLIAGVDLAYAPGGDRAWAGVVVLALPDLDPVESVWAAGSPAFPYIPGYLSFREGPLILKAVRRLRSTPDLWLFDGQGIAHPRGFGLAAHVGLLLNAPSVGCAKSRLVGTHHEPGRFRRAWSPLRYQGETVGAVLRTRTGVRPLYVSPGHLIDLPSSIQWVLAASPRFRVPEPIRQAEGLVNRLKRTRTTT